MVDEERGIYSKLGVSSKKEDVHKAIENLDKGLFPHAFCKIVPDINGRKDYCSIFHADGAGTKSSLAYMYFKEMGDLSVFRGIVRDAIVMNIDDLLCAGAIDNIFLSNNIGRNANLIPGEIISIIIGEYSNYCKKLSSLGFNVEMCGGETADVGDLVKTLILDATAFTSIKRENVIDTYNIKNGDVIVGLESSGKASYEENYNSGIGSNGLTLARHGTLSHEYFHKYPECFDKNLDENMVFFGKYKLTDEIKSPSLNIGKALLSPTRTYLPIIRDILLSYRTQINAIIHNTGGGQTKILNFGYKKRYIKNNLFNPPEIFKIIQESSNTSWYEMYQVFNMGHRIEIICDESIAQEIISISKKYKINGKIVGYCENSEKERNHLILDTKFGKFEYK
ncbi:MAG: phosphoribosylformylglycinamidine cyclo-ligase [Candidatus Lokiarchaeota archaeon]|nr:phosphoribosylformylglycinamidine cyclo-ligase [Candidatus Lokiarchaeota archaeon]MBD3201494.1 phosphoribosylformylglycinamidine cyclo-ligase [Candidatus Lokiarchaeota archaeon]